MKTFIVLLALGLGACASGNLSALDQVPPDYKVLVGVWTWRPMQPYEPANWVAQLTITDVSDTGLVMAEWRDPGRTIPFTTQAWMKEGKIRLTFGSTWKFNLEYDRGTDTLSGPLTDVSPQYARLAAWKTAYFRRIK